MSKKSLLRQSAQTALAAAAFAVAGGLSVMPAHAQEQPAPAIDRTVLPHPNQSFEGVIAPTRAESRPDWVDPVTAPEGAPNVFLIMTDDVGFASASTFGGPVPMPNLDRLAERGLTYTQFHTTAVCSPSRASLLTGRNAHAVGGGILFDIPTGYPGYSAVIPQSAATIGRVLRDNGYSTAWFGKHHNAAPWNSMAGPYEQWPTGLGFDYFYGFVGGDVNQWEPRLYRGTSLVEVDLPEGETLDHEFADDAIHWLHTQSAAAPDRPFFIYYAPGTAHAPHQAPMDWINRFEGQFDQGWDRLREQIFARQRASGIVPRGTRLTPRPDGFPAWDSMSPDAQRVYSRMMEVFAGMLSYQDAQIGRIFDELERMGELDNTLVIFIGGDNGGSAEGALTGSLNEIGTFSNGVEHDVPTLLEAMPNLGGPDTYQHFPGAWAWSLNTPFQWSKQISSHLGGTRNGMVLSWPDGIRREGGVRRQFSHLNDIMPTILEATGIPAPVTVDGVTQQPLDGVSLMYSFDQPNAPEQHRTQYFELSGTRAIYHDGWMANTRPTRLPWQFLNDDAPGDAPVVWELYNLRRDFSQSRDLAAQEPERLEALQQLWDEEARRNNVYPIDDRSFSARGVDGALAYAGARRSNFTYWGPDISIMTHDAPAFVLQPFEISAQVQLPNAQTNGVLIATGSQFGGWSFYLDEGRPVAVHAVSGPSGLVYRVAADAPVPAGDALIRYTFTPDRPAPLAGGTMRIFIGDRLVGEGHIERTILTTAGLGETFDTGRDTGAPVTRDYENEGRFEGEIERIDVTLGSAR